MRKSLKKVCCYVLSLAMALSSGVTVPFGQVKAEASETQQSTAALKINSLVTAVVDGTGSRTMNLYANGTYETKLELEAGTHSIQVKVDGTDAGKEKSITLDSAGVVYVRYQDGKVYDSINNEDKKFHTAALTGNFAGIEFLDKDGKRYDIASWKPSDSNGDLDYIGGGIFKKTFLFKELTEDVEIKDGGYKISFDDDDTWGYSFGNGSGNIPLTIPKGSTSLTVFVDEINQKVYDSVRSGEVSVTQNSGTVTYPAFDMPVSLIGEVRGSDGTWDASNTEYDFTQISDKLYVYQKILNTGSYEYKTVFNYEKWYEKSSGNKKIVVSSDNTNVIFVYDAETESLYDSINDNSKLAIMFGMEEEPEKPAESQVVNNANGTTTFITTAAASESSKVQLVYADKDNASETKTVDLTKQTDSKGNYKGAFASDEIFFGDGAQDIIYYYLVDGVKTLDSSAASTKVDEIDYSVYQRDIFTGRPVYVPGTFPGKSWDAASNQMTYEGNGLYSYTFKNVPAANYNFKIAMGTWSENYGANGKFDGENYAVTVTATQDVTVYYTDLTTHMAVTSVDYVFADITMTGTAIPSGTKLTDAGLTGIYSTAVSLPAGTYSDITLKYNGKSYVMDSFTLDGAKEVIFYFDPATEIYYNNSTEKEVDTDSVTYDSKDTVYKSPYGAVEAGTPITFSIKTGSDVTKAKIVIKGKTNQVTDLTKKSDEDIWSGNVTISEYGQYQYFFVLYYGSSIKIYCDDDGYYGTGVLTDLTSLKPYDLVVYKAGYKTPDWMKNAVIYQIFPDRFYNGNTKNDDAQTTSRGATNYEFIKDWSLLPENPEQEKLHADSYPSNAFFGDGNWSNEIYGGDLQGIVKRIDYLKALGVNVIYLNPVFSSISSHRYDTSDYKEIDPILGDLGDFSELVNVCKKNNMHLILDGVFNHVSDDSIYFDRYYKFVGKNGKVGAYPYWAYVYDYMAEHSVSQATAESAARTYFKGLGVTDFAYTEWFNVTQTYLTDENGTPVQDTIGDRKGKSVYGYEGWWGYDSMPVIKSTNGSEYQTGNWGSEVIEGSDSIGQYWLKQGSNGWRLDVANEVSDETWQHFRQSVKALNSDNVIIGEIWDDATQYILGDMYDSVMNYVFRNAVLGYVKGQSAKDAMKTLEKIRERYPKEAFYAMMNLVGSHDTTRLLSYLDGIDDDRKQTEVEQAFPSYEKTSEQAKKMQYLTAFIQMTYPGAPTIYYGDELGMTGADDPDNRRAMTWGEGNKELLEWYATLAKIRSVYSELRTGDFEPFDVKVNGADSSNLIGYTRGSGNSKMIVLTNNAAEDITVSLNVGTLLGSTVNKVTDLISGTDYNTAGSTAQVKVPAYKGVILTTNVKTIQIDEEALKPGYDESFKVSDNVPSAAPSVSPSSSPSSSTSPKPSVNPSQVPVKKLGKTVGLKVTAKTYSSVSLSWKAVKDAEGYQVYQHGKNGWTKVAETKKTSCTVKGLVWSGNYAYRVRAYATVDKKEVYGAFSSVVKVTTKAVSKPGKVRKPIASWKEKDKLKISWNKAADATKYEVYQKTGNGSYKRVKTVTGQSVILSNLNRKKTYQFKIRAVKTVNEKSRYGSFSSVVKVK